MDTPPNCTMNGGKQASDVVHQQWLERNGNWAPAEQNKPYNQLAESEKEKDRVIVRGAVDFVNRKLEASGFKIKFNYQI